jgi:serine/threonine protein phosphatase PrpC
MGNRCTSNIEPDTAPSESIVSFDDVLGIAIDSQSESNKFIRIEGRLSNYPNLSYHTEQGTRPYQEDRTSVARLEDDREIFAIFDGHGGSEVSNRAKTELIQILKRPAMQVTDSESALRRSFKTFGDQIRKEEVGSGSTAVVCILDREQNRLSVGNVGDSFCLIIDGHKREVRRLTEDHKPDVGRVKPHRGNSSGSLALSQSFGDFKYPIIHQGYYKTASLENITHIVLASDGVSDAMTDQMIMETLSNPSSNTAEKLIEKAINGRMRSDNATAIVITLDTAETIDDTAETIDDTYDAYTYASVSSSWSSSS